MNAISQDLEWMYLNKEAAALIRQSRYSEAEHLLDRALARLESQAMSSGVCKEVSDDQMRSFIRTTRLYPVDANGPLSVKSQDDELGTFELYDKLFLLPPEANITAEFVAAAPSSFSKFWFCVVLYNMGLCWHLMALCSGMDIHYTKAAYAYETAIACLEREKYYMGTMKMWLELALLNNCAHISNSCLNMDSTRGCVFHMAQNLHCLVHAEDEGEERLDRSLVTFFMANVRSAQQVSGRHAPQA